MTNLDLPMPESVTVILCRPSRALSPNGRTHWAAKAKAAKSARFLAEATALVALRDFRKPNWINAVVTIAYVGGKRMDMDNALASCKAYLDGIVDAGVLLDDKGIRFDAVTWQPAPTRKDAKAEYLRLGGPHVRVTVVPE